MKNLVLCMKYRLVSLWEMQVNGLLLYGYK